MKTFYWGGGGVLGALMSNPWYQCFKGRSFHMGEINTAMN